MPRDYGEKQSVLSELSVGQVYGSGEYQQLYLLGSIFITQVLDQKYVWIGRDIALFPVIPQPLQWGAECVRISVTFNVIFQRRQRFLP